MSLTPATLGRFEHAAFWLACLFLLVLIVIRFAEPIQDGDLFWHLAYARQMLESHTLVPDATIYAWTPTSTAMIYCAWLAELALYGLWWLGGETAMFVLRYAAVGLIVALLWHHAHRFGQARRAITPLLILIVVLASAPVTPTKPELVSVLFTHLLLWLFAGARHADQRIGGQPSSVGATAGAERWLWAVPALMLVWVNSHGGFILAAPLMAAMLAGELANRRWAPALALSAPAQRTLWLAWIATALTTLLTPYGWAYPRQLLADYVFGATARPDVAWNNAHQNLFSAAGWSLHLPEYGALMLGLLAWLAWRARRARQPVDAVSVLLVLVALPLYVVYLRSSYLLPAVFGYLALAMWPPSVGVSGIAPASVDTKLRRRTRGRRDGATIGIPPRAMPVVSARLLGVLASVTALALAGAVVARTGWEARCRPEPFSWSGFGIGHINPVEEAEWLAQNRLGERLYNIFDSGGYLLWRLYPGYRVMVDSRSYPYLDWFDDQYRFSMGERFDSFLRQYPADVAVIDLAKAPAWRNFLRSRQWRPLFVGATAAVFARIDDTRAMNIRYQPAPGLEAIRNAAVALRVFDFAVDAGDWQTAWRLADRLQGPLACQLSPRVLTAVENHRLAYQLALSGDYREASERLDRALARKYPGERDQAMLMMLKALAMLGDPASPQGAKIQAGLAQLLAQRQ